MMVNVLAIVLSWAGCMYALSRGERAVVSRDWGKLVWSAGQFAVFLMLLGINILARA